MARGLHVSGGSALCRHRLRAIGRHTLPGREPAPRHHDGRRFRNGPFRVGRCAVRGCATARNADDRRQGADGSTCACRPARHRDARIRREQGIDQPLASSRSPRLCDHAAIRRHVVAAAARDGRHTVARVARGLRAIPRRRERGRGCLDHVALSGAGVLSRRVRAIRPAWAPGDLRAWNSPRRKRLPSACRVAHGARALSDIEQFPRQRPVRAPSRARPGASGARRAGDGSRRRHGLLDAAHDAGGERRRAPGGFRRPARPRRSTSTPRSARSRPDARPISSSSISAPRR